MDLNEFNVTRRTDHGIGSPLWAFNTNHLRSPESMYSMIKREQTEPGHSIQHHDLQEVSESRVKALERQPFDCERPCCCVAPCFTIECNTRPAPVEPAIATRTQDLTNFLCTNFSSVVQNGMNINFSVRQPSPADSFEAIIPLVYALCDTW